MQSGHRSLDQLRAAPKGLYLTGTPALEIDDDAATGVQTLCFVDQKTHAMRIGYYNDTYVRTPDGWRLRSLLDGDGSTTTDFSAGLDQASGVAIQQDGKIVAVGRADIAGAFDFAGILAVADSLPVMIAFVDVRNDSVSTSWPLVMPMGTA